MSSPNFILKRRRDGFKSDETNRKTERNSRRRHRRPFIKCRRSLRSEYFNRRARHRRILERTARARHLSLHATLQYVKRHLKRRGDQTRDDADADVLPRLFHERLRRGQMTLAPVYASEITRVKDVISQTRRPKSRV